MALKTYRDQYRFKRQKRLIYRAFFSILTFVIFIYAVIYLLFFAKGFDVRAITISGNETISADDLRAAINQNLDKKIFFITVRSNIFLASINKLEKTLAKNYPKIETLAIKRNFFHGLELTIKERKPIGIWCLNNQGDCFYFDQSDIAFQKVPKTSGFLFLTVDDLRDRKVQLGQFIETDEWVNPIVIARDMLWKNNFQVDKFTIPDGSFGEFQTITPTGWKILFSIKSNVKAQVDAMAGFIEQKLTPDKLSKLEYIDLRINDKIYFK